MTQDRGSGTAELASRAANDSSQAAQSQHTVAEQAARARRASRVLARANRATKDKALHEMAAAVDDAVQQILAANAVDVAAAEEADTAPALVDRLRLTGDRVAEMTAGLRSLAGLPDPVGDVVRGWTNPDGVQIRQVRVPFGVIGIIYEARPNVTADAAGICLKSGNAVLLRGSSSAAHSNAAITTALRHGLTEADLPADSVQLVPGPRTVTDELMAARGQIDLLIPRGGAGLINHVVGNSLVPVIETGVGNCHLYVDADADLSMAIDILINAKTQRPSVCNAVETLLVHREIAEDFIPVALEKLIDAGVTIHGDELVAHHARAGTPVLPATDEDFATEYNSLDIAVAEVDSLSQAIAHIRRYSTGHSETIITDSQPAAQRFVAEIDAAAVLVNASSRFVDGGEFGFGAEIGISTQKLHARGPMALPEMTTTKYVVTGSGQVRG